MVHALSSYTLLAWVMRVKLALGSLFVHKGIFGNYIRLHRGK